MADTTAITVTRTCITSPLHRYTKWVYELPPTTIEQHTEQGTRTVTLRPGGHTSKTETRSLIRRTYPQRPLNINWPDGTTDTLHR